MKITISVIKPGNFYFIKFHFYQLVIFGPLPNDIDVYDFKYGGNICELYKNPKQLRELSKRHNYFKKEQK